MLFGTLQKPLIASANYIESINNKILHQEINDNYFTEVSKTSNQLFLFRDTAYYTIAIDYSLSTNLTSIYHLDKYSGIITSTSLSNIYDLISYSFNAFGNQSNIDLLKSIPELVINQEIQLENPELIQSRWYEDMVINDYQSMMPFSAVTNQTVIAALRDIGHGPQAFARTGSTASGSGFTARIYLRTTLQNAVSVAPFVLAARVTLAAAAITLGKPQAAVKQIVAIVDDAGQARVANRSDVQRHRVSVFHTREARIDGYRGSWATDHRDLQYDVWVGPLGAGTPYRRWDVPFQHTILRLLNNALGARINAG